LNKLALRQWYQLLRNHHFFSHPDAAALA
jgi:hypothetical protein